MRFPQPHTVTILTPTSSTDRRGDQTVTLTATKTVRGWMQQMLGPRGQHEEISDRDQRQSLWTLYTDQAPDLTALDRVQWDNRTFTVDGQPNHLQTPRGYHHTEAQLQLVEG